MKKNRLHCRKRNSGQKQLKDRQDKQLPRQREQTLKTKEEQYRTIKKTWVNSCTPKG